MTPQTSAVLNTRPLSPRVRGISMVLIAASLWGLSGTAAQQLFQHDGFHAGWLVTTRMTISGMLLLIMVHFGPERKTVWTIWQNRQSALELLIFGIVGLVGVQYSYFASIRFGNAATATFLQYVGPAVISVYIAVRFRKLPTFRESLAVALALGGTFLLVTNGSLHMVVVPHAAVVWGLISAVALAFYTVFPANLIRRHGSAVTVGWAMFIGGAALGVFVQPWHADHARWTVLSTCLVVFVVLLGTLLPFYLYLASLRYISPSETSLIGCVEPLSAALASVLWLHVRMGVMTDIGAALILSTVVMLAIKPRE